MTTKTQIKIFIVEDNILYANTLRGFLKTNFPNVKIKIYHTGEMFLAELFLKPDIVIMDYFLNSKYDEALNGLEIIRQIKNQNPDTHIIVLSIQEKYSVIIKAIALYQCSYVQKDNEAFNKVAELINDLI
jgi:DNA-binding NarL/FixJ family response regulator